MACQPCTAIFFARKGEGHCPFRKGRAQDEQETSSCSWGLPESPSAALFILHTSAKASRARRRYLLPENFCFPEVGNGHLRGLIFHSRSAKPHWRFSRRVKSRVHSNWQSTAQREECLCISFRAIGQDMSGTCLINLMHVALPADGPRHVLTLTEQPHAGFFQKKNKRTLGMSTRMKLYGRVMYRPVCSSWCSEASAAAGTLGRVEAGVGAKKGGTPTARGPCAHLSWWTQTEACS